MGVMDSVDDALTKAAKFELDMLNSDTAEGKMKNKNKANLYFKRAMMNDGHDDYNGKVIE